MDVHCCNCGEPWEVYYLWDELEGIDIEELESEGWQFGKCRLVVLHCPCCHLNGERLPDAELRSDIVQELSELLGDDVDGLASTLEDFGL